MYVDANSIIVTLIKFIYAKVSLKFYFYWSYGADSNFLCT